MSAKMQPVIDAVTRAAAPKELTEGLVGIVVPSDGRVEIVDVVERMAKHAEHPDRKRGTFAVHGAESFVAYLAKHGEPETEVWADAINARILGIVNAHGVSAGWADHRVLYSVQHTPAWRAWTERDGKYVDQSTFAELIEDRLTDIVRPAAADMLELAQTFQATIGVRFESSKLLSSGERQLAYRETVDAKAGRAGNLEIPRDFDLALVPFEGAAAFKVTARFRYRITDGELRVGFRLNRPEDVLREAFGTVVEAIASGVDAPVFMGAPQ